VKVNNRIFVEHTTNLPAGLERDTLKTGGDDGHGMAWGEESLGDFCFK
jgi:hypothetical protein